MKSFAASAAPSPGRYSRSATVRLFFFLIQTVMQSQWKHFKAEWERLSLWERLMLVAFFLSLATVWLVKPPDPPPYKWHRPLHRHALNYYMKK